MRIVVAGATGLTGRLVVHGLVQRGTHVRAVVRDPAKAASLLPDSVVPIVADVRDGAALAGVCDGVDAVVSALGTRSYVGGNGLSAVDVSGNRHLAVEAARAGAERFVLLSAFGLDRRSPFLSLFSAALGRYFHHKAAAEAAVRTSGVRAVVVRPVELRNRPPRRATVLNQDRPLSLLRTVSREAVAEVMVRAALGQGPECVLEVCEGDGPGLDEAFAALRPGGLRLSSPYTPLW